MEQLLRFMDYKIARGKYIPTHPAKDIEPFTCLLGGARCTSRCPNYFKVLDQVNIIMQDIEDRLKENKFAVTDSNPVNSAITKVLSQIESDEDKGGCPEIPPKPILLKSRRHGLGSKIVQIKEHLDRFSPFNKPR